MGSEEGCAYLDCMSWGSRSASNCVYEPPSSRENGSEDLKPGYPEEDPA